METWSKVAALDKGLQDELVSKLKELYLLEPLNKEEKEIVLIIEQKKS